MLEAVEEGAGAGAAERGRGAARGAVQREVAEQVGLQHGPDGLVAHVVGGGRRGRVDALRAERLRQRLALEIPPKQRPSTAT